MEELRRDEIELILDGAEEILAAGHHRRKKRDDLAGKVIVNLFFEPSTRTRTSFSLAAAAWAPTRSISRPAAPA